MTQFNVKSLSRLLSQVEREVLVGAAEDAQLQQFFDSFERGVLRELGEWFNVIANINVFGLDVLGPVLQPEDPEAGTEVAEQLLLWMNLINGFLNIIRVLGDIFSPGSSLLNQFDGDSRKLTAILKQLGMLEEDIAEIDLPDIGLPADRVDEAKTKISAARTRIIFMRDTDQEAQYNPTMASMVQLTLAAEELGKALIALR